MHDIPGMTVSQHHELCIGVLACCYQYAPADLKQAILDGFKAAQQMGMNIQPENVLIGDPLHAEIRMLRA